MTINQAIRDHLSKTTTAEIEIAFARLTSEGEAFSAAEVIGAAGVAVVEYEEKHFQGPSMSDDEWSTL